MSDYIDRGAFLADQRKIYCENCIRRMGMKRGRMQFVYEIGDAPCRACGVCDVLDDVEAAPAADVAPVKHGYWVGEYDGYADGNPCYDTWHCSECGWECDDDEEPTWKFCPNCGAKMDESLEGEDDD